MTLSLRTHRRMRVPPRAETKARLPEVAAQLHAMRTPVFVIPNDKHTAELKAQLAAAEQKLHDQASLAWLHEESRIRQQRMEQLVTRQSYAETARVRDNTRPDLTPQAVITTDSVKLKLALNPRTAVPMQLPWFSRIKRWALRKP